jgi:O-antigen/teichoic acid export membrane protein
VGPADAVVSGEPSPDAAPVPDLSIASGAALKYGAEALSLLLSFAVGIITARNLGPTRKGDFATMGYLAVIVGSAASLGLGDAAVNLMAQRRCRLDEATSASLTALALSSLGGLIAYAGVSWALFADDWAAVRVPVALTAATVPVIACTLVLGVLVDSRRRFAATSVARVAGPSITVVATWLLVTVARRHMTGAALGALIGWLVVPLVLAVALRRIGALVRPRWNGHLLRRALAIGVPIQTAQLLMTATARVDLLIVHLVGDDAAAGRYSVALTLGSLNTFAALALSAASFPHTAQLAAHEVTPFTFRAARLALLISILVAVPIGILLPWLTPFAFGDGFRGAARPAIVLLVSGALWSVQFVLCRARAARGDGKALIQSFAGSLTSMVVGDFVLVPALGIMGAAYAAVLSSAVGIAIIVRAYPDADVRQFVPGREDLRDLLSRGRRIVREPRAAVTDDRA